MDCLAHSLLSPLCHSLSLSLSHFLTLSLSLSFSLSLFSLPSLSLPTGVEILRIQRVDEDGKDSRWRPGRAGGTALDGYFRT